MANTVFILGGARSGKSAIAERMAEQSERPRLYLATAQAQDGEMAARIGAHRARRGEGWTTLEVPVEIAEVLLAPAHAQAVILVDCLTLWLSNLMQARLDVAAQSARLVEALSRTQAQVLLVSSEVGQGIVPDNALAREFRDAAGLLHQQVAAVAARVVWVAAGIPTVIKGA